MKKWCVTVRKGEFSEEKEEVEAYTWTAQFGDVTFFNLNKEKNQLERCAYLANVISIEEVSDHAGV